MAKKVTASDMPSTDFIDSAEILGQLIKAKRTELGINTLSRIENGNANCTLAA